jgi:hypothetical protein
MSQSAIDMMWKTVENHNEEIQEFLTKGIQTKNTSSLLFLCLKIVLVESLYNDRYKKYKPKRYNNSDFIDLTIETMINKYNSMESKQEDIREIAWGHIRSRSSDLISLYRKIQNPCFDILEEDEKSMLLQCSAVVLVELLLKNKKLLILEG